MAEIPPSEVPSLCKRKEAGETWASLSDSTGYSIQVLKFYIRPLLNPEKPSEETLNTKPRRGQQLGHRRRSKY